MPELPEVETVRRGLAPVMEGSRIIDVALRRKDLRFPFPRGFRARLTGKQITHLGRRAKYLLIHLEGDLTLIAHLGMSGRFIVAPESAASTAGKAVLHHQTDRLPAHDHVTLTLAGRGKRNAAVIYNDPRRFGFMDLAKTSALEQCRHFEGMGPEPLGNGFNWPALAEPLKGKKTPIKQALLDQKVVAGLGNIYVCEALWQAGISPKRMAGSLGPARGERLILAVQEILQRAIAAGGSSLKDHAQVDGSLGYFQHSFRVYDREGQACPKCGKQIKRFVQSGRSTYLCSFCQR